jgi:TetR/AcrR family transcriptional regulator, repressor for neighboring sulfatase
MSRVRRPRRRRSPEVARQELLDAAERMFATHGPEHVGLKEVARAAGVSHALVTHYFGTYGGLVQATLERRIVALRQRTLERLRDAAALARPDELLATLFETFEDPVHLRLMKWMLAHETPAALHALAAQHHGIQTVARQVAGALTPDPSRALLDALELALLAATSAAFGYAVGKHALAGALGRAVSPELDASVRQAVAAMLEHHVRSLLAKA